MTNLIRIENRDGRESVNARDLHAALEVKTEFKDWIARRIEAYGFIDGKDFRAELSESTGGRPAKEYVLSVSMAKELATVENNDKGKEVRRYLIQVEEAWNTPSAIMARALQVAAKELENRDAKIKELEPKAAFFDAVADSKDAKDMRNVAAVLNIPGMGRNNIFKILREAKILDNENVPYREYQDRGYFRVILTKYTTPDGEIHTNSKTLVYPKGIEYIRKAVVKGSVSSASLRRVSA